MFYTDGQRCYIHTDKGMAIINMCKRHKIMSVCIGYITWSDSHSMKEIDSERDRIEKVVFMIRIPTIFEGLWKFVNLDFSCQTDNQSTDFKNTS